MTNRDELRAQRAALIERLHALPDAMKSLPQWLLWKSIKKSADKKPAKMPFYANGSLRGWPKGQPADGKPTEAQPQVEQGDPLDRAALVSFDQAVAAMQASESWAGIGFAFLPGDGLIGVDLDGAISEDGEISPRCRHILAMCPSYTELSVSGRGLHIILAGKTETFKSDEIGVEVYCNAQFFTCTGRRFGDAPEAVQPMEAEALSILRGMVEQAKREARERREAERLAARGAQAAPAAARPADDVVQTPGDSSRNDFRLVNDRALQYLSAWVPELLPAARPYRGGYRVSSKDLGRQLEEDLSLLPEGIQDFGEEEGKTAIDVVMQWGRMGAAEALRWLAARVGVSLAPRRPRSTGGRRPEPEDEAAEGGEAGGPGGSHHPRPPEEDVPPDTPGGGGGGGGSEGGDAGQEEGEEGDGGGKKGRKPSKRALANLALLHDRFAYQFGSKVAWDTKRREAIEISNLRNTFGADAVKMWMASEVRWMVYQEDVMFEPGVDLGERRINLFQGMPVEPVKPEPGECDVMLELLRYLCSTSEAPGMGPDEIVDWVLCWLSLPLQRPGAKMATALVFHGPQGTGKNLFFDCIRDLYGEYGVMVGQTELEEKYNAWLSAKLFIVGDEVVSRQEMYHTKNRLKWIISQEQKIPIRSMHADTRWESNHANLVFLSNESQPLALEQGDRRFMVIYTPVAEDGTLYARVRAFLASGGAAKFLHFLMHRELGDFETHTKPPLTKAKETLIELGLKPAERFMHEWLRGYLPLPMRVCSVEQLYRCFRRWCDSTGARFYPAQAEFTLQASRYALEQIERDEEGRRKAPPFRLKNIQVPDESTTTGRKCYRCWIPRGCGFREGDQLTDEGDAFPPTEGRWARECIDDFEPLARSFLRTHRAEDEGGEGGGDAA